MRGEHHVMMGAETEVDTAANQGTQGLLTNHQGLDSVKASPLQVSERAWSCQNLDLELLASRTGT